MRLLLLTLLLFVPLKADDSADASTARLKELISFEGIRDNQLIGYGLVVGLNSTGDHQTTFFSAQSLANMLQQMGVSVNPGLLLVKDTAAVMVTATLPAFAQAGTHIDVNAAAIGDAQNLQGGVLLLTSLKGVDGQVYALAQGPVVTGGFGSGKGGNTETVNHPTVGRVPAGATVERTAPSIEPKGKLRIQLRTPDFITALRISKAINAHYADSGKSLAEPETSATVRVTIPPDYSGRVVEFIAGIESLEVQADRPARVIVNERTGTIVMGKQVRVSPVAIMHGKLTVEIQSTPQVSQPNAFSQGGQTKVVDQTKVSAHEEQSRALMFKEGATVEQLVRALGAIGSTARDVIAILESLRAAGALEADIQVI